MYNPRNYAISIENYAQRRYNNPIKYHYTEDKYMGTHQQLTIEQIEVLEVLRDLEEC